MEAIDKIERGNVYDIIFMDHMMPEMDGIEAVKRIRAEGYNRPIVALTANAVAGQADVFMANGFDGFISKPIDIREMNSVLNKYVRDRQPMEVIEATRAAYGADIISEGKTPQVDSELAKIFIQDAEKAIEVLESSEGSNLQLYTINVHALKSALANIGEKNLSDFARELEGAGKDGNIFLISDKTPVFLSKLRAVIDKLKSADGGYGAGEVSSEDMELLREKLQAIKDACENYNANAAMAVLKELKQKQWPSPYGELLDTITMHILRSDFDEAGEVCKL
jgi:CheY-like chemotaxis protein